MCLETLPATTEADGDLVWCYHVIRVTCPFSLYRFSFPPSLCPFFLNFLFLHLSLTIALSPSLALSISPSLPPSISSITVARSLSLSPSFLAIALSLSLSLSLSLFPQKVNKKMTANMLEIWYSNGCISTSMRAGDLLLVSTLWFS